jgi:hypothetical protein
MSLPSAKIPYLQLGGLVMGNHDLTQIDTIGGTIEALKQKFALPPYFQPDGTPQDYSKLLKGSEAGVT